jgi:hypothetical protein
MPSTPLQLFAIGTVATATSNNPANGLQDAMGFFGKLLTIAAVIVIAWFGWRWWQRSIEAASKPPGRQPTQPPPPAEPPAKPGRPAVEDLVACGVCGAYVPSGTVHCDKRAA